MNHSKVVLNSYAIAHVTNRCSPPVSGEIAKIRKFGLCQLETLIHRYHSYVGTPPELFGIVWLSLVISF